jgi:tetratricopeptide (TPR) repeat protein
LTKRNLFLAMAAIVIAARCATAPPPPPAPAPAAGNDRFLVDPRIGFTATDNLNRRFEIGWRSFLSGDLATARKAFGDLRVKNPDYLPASLGEAAIDIKEGNLDRASQLVERAIARNRDYTAAQIYEAEIAAREHRLHSANQLYTALAAAPGAPDVVKERLAEVRQQLFDELLAFASTAPNAESVRLLREALTIDPHARTARLLLVQRLMADKNWEEARRVLTPLTSSADVDNTDVQSALAEIEIGQGQYEQAIVRYERLARREKDPRFGKRLEEVKEEWTATNMPPQYRRALESEAIRRDDLAVLLYWKVASIRFAQNLGAPPIAVDIGEVAGRDEIIRAIALGVLPVDAVTRRVNPFAQVNAAAFTRLAARVLFLRGADCARQRQSSSPEPAHSQAILAACRVNDPGLTLPPDAPVSGRTAAAVFEQIDNALSR